jgi:hypothetical protein
VIPLIYARAIRRSTSISHKVLRCVLSYTNPLAAPNADRSSTFFSYSHSSPSPSRPSFHPIHHPVSSFSTTPSRPRSLSLLNPETTTSTATPTSFSPSPLPPTLPSSSRSSSTTSHVVARRTGKSARSSEKEEGRIRSLGKGRRCWMGSRM